MSSSWQFQSRCKRLQQISDQAGPIQFVGPFGTEIPQGSTEIWDYEKTRIADFKTLEISLLRTHIGDAHYSFFAEVEIIFTLKSGLKRPATKLLYTGAKISLSDIMEIDQEMDQVVFAVKEVGWDRVVIIDDLNNFEDDQNPDLDYGDFFSEA